MTDNNPLGISQFMDIPDSQGTQSDTLGNGSIYSGTTLAPTSFQVDSTEVVRVASGSTVTASFQIFNVRRQGLAGSGFDSNKKYITVPQITLYVNNDDDDGWLYPNGTDLLGSGLVLPIVSILPQYLPVQESGGAGTDQFADGIQQFIVAIYNFDPIPQDYFLYVRFLSVPTRGVPLNEGQ